MELDDKINRVNNNENNPASGLFIMIFYQIHHNLVQLNNKIIPFRL